MRHATSWFVIAVSVGIGAGCTTSDTTGPSEAARGLGIDHYDVTETDTHVTVVGVGDDGAVRARVELEQGWISLVLDDPREVYGRRMLVEVWGDEIQHESEGVDQLSLPL